MEGVAELLPYVTFPLRDQAVDLAFILAREIGQLKVKTHP